MKKAGPELIEAMKQGAVSRPQAEEIAKLPKEEQPAALQAPRAARAHGKPMRGKTADALREDLKAAQEAGQSMLCSYARLLLGAIHNTENITQEERDLLGEVRASIPDSDAADPRDALIEELRDRVAFLTEEVEAAQEEVDSLAKVAEGNAPMEAALAEAKKYRGLAGGLERRIQSMLTEIAELKGSVKHWKTRAGVAA